MANFKPIIHKAHARVTDEYIQKNLTSEYDFNNHEVESIKQKLLKCPNTCPELKKYIESICAQEQKIKSQFLTVAHKFDKLWALYAYSMIANQQKVFVIRSHVLKEIICKHMYNFANDSKPHQNASYSWKYNVLMNIDNLIILELGYENDINNVNYFLDFLPEFIYQRNKKKLVTLSCSDISINGIKDHISKNTKYIKTSVNEKKLSYCMSLLANKVCSGNV